MREVIGNCELYLGDCFDILPTLGPVNACILDPPYQLSSAGPGQSHFGMSLDKFDSDAYKDIVNGFDVERLFGLLDNICAPFNMFCFCSNKQISRIMQYHENKKRPTTLLVWHKINAAPFANGVWRGDLEYIVHARDAGATFEGGAREKKRFHECGTIVDSEHPTVKPLALVSKYVKICSKPGDVVLDCYMGSGTVGIACVKMGRRFIGIEKDPVYFALACKRIADAHRQADMFLP